MRKVALIFLLCCALYPCVYAQKRGLERDSLPVFVVRDKALGVILDNFIAAARKFENKFPVTYHINIDLGDEVMSISLNIKEQRNVSDSVSLYKNSNIHQAFIRHRDILFFAKIKSSPYAYKYDILIELIKKLPTNQVVYFKDTPPDFFDLSLWGGNPLEGTIFSSFHEYDGKKWSHGIFEDDK